MLYSYLIKPFLFLLQAEKAHHVTTTLFSILLKVPILGWVVKSFFRYENIALEKELFGIKFPNPVGLAAGFDKDGKHYRTMSHLGFGFIEIGTVTPLPQDGNPKPRSFRLPKDGGLINRMGFNNEGVEAMVSRIKERSHDIIIGGNIGKNKVTPNEEAILDYEKCFKALYPYVDYFVINVSSPNTPGLRSLQDKEPLSKLIAHITALRSKEDKYLPILLKIAPDLSDEQIDDALEILTEYKMDGIIATNTTISRSDLKTATEEIESIGNGGLSGAPLRSRSAEVVRYIRSKKPELPIIGVGGITSTQSAQSMLDAGADLIQVYSGLVYSGPSLIKKIKKHLVQLS